MKRIDIDFSPTPAPVPAWPLLLFAVGAAVCMGATWRIGSFGMQEERAVAQLARARAQVHARTPRPPAPVQIAAGKAAAINAAIAELNLPWQTLFTSLEQVKPANVALLGLEPDAAKRVLRINAEAKQAEDMLDFVRLLGERPQFSSAVLVKHEIYAQDPNRPLRFIVEATWKDAP